MSPLGRRLAHVIAALAIGTLATADQPAAVDREAAVTRARALEMFARAYYPGRSGQIAVVPREGDIVTRRSPELVFMHGSPWPYDARIPLIFWGPGRVKPGTFPAPVAQQDVAPTLARLIGFALPSSTGRVLEEAIAAGGPPPRAAVLLVLDGMRADYLDRHSADLPTLARLRREGAAFTQARVTHIPTITSIGHATLATGTDPRLHGIVSNTLFDRVARKDMEIFAGLSPRNLMAPTLGDAWNLETDGRAIVAAQTSTVNGTGLAGHGSCLVNARATLYASYDPRTGGWTTDAACFRLPRSYAGLDSRAVWEKHGGTWMGHPIGDSNRVRRSAPFATYEGDALVALLESEPIGQDDVADLVFVNLKVPDFVGHAYGPDSPELRASLVETDRQIARVVETLDARIGRGRYVLAIAADHGMPAEPRAGGRHYVEDVVKLLHERFDPEGRLVIHYGPENSQIQVDRGRLAERGLTLEQVRDFLRSQPWVFAAFTEDEIRRVRLP